MSRVDASVRRMLEPRSIAVVGASDRPGSFGRRMTGEVLRSTGVESGEIGPVDADEFAVTWGVLLDGLSIQVALKDEMVDAAKAFDIAMRFAEQALALPARAAGPAGTPA